jgi:hypothetical protein
MEQHGVVSAMTRLRTRRIASGFPARARGLYLLWNVHKKSGAHPDSYSIGSGRLVLRGGSHYDVKLTNQLHLVPRLRISGDIPSLPLTPSWRVYGEITSYASLWFMLQLRTAEIFKDPQKVRSGCRNLIYLLSAFGLPPGGSSTVHIYTQTLHRTTQNKQYIEQHKRFENNTTILEGWRVIPWHLSYNWEKSTDKHDLPFRSVSLQLPIPTWCTA